MNEQVPASQAEHLVEVAGEMHPTVFTRVRDIATRIGVPIFVLLAFVVANKDLFLRIVSDVQNKDVGAVEADAQAIILAWEQEHS